MTSNQTLQDKGNMKVNVLIGYIILILVGVSTSFVGIYIGQKMDKRTQQIEQQKGVISYLQTTNVNQEEKIWNLQKRLSVCTKIDPYGENNP